MHEELKRCNYLGDIESIYTFSQIAIVDHITDIDSVINICMLNPQINVKPKACVLFFNEIGLIDINNNEISPRNIGLEINHKDIQFFVSKTVELTLNFLLDNGYMNTDAIMFDVVNLKCMIKKSAFPLSVAVFRNYLIDAGMMEDISGSMFLLSDYYEQIFEENIKLRKNVISLDQLKERQLAQEAQGRKAEEYVVEFEKRRLNDHAMKDMIRQISDFDVTAGFDIVSFNKVDSKVMDRFIEVKSFHTTPHFFWSSNEVSVAKMKNVQYYLYLVDMDRYFEENYEPLIVPNPANCLFESTDWIINAASYELTKV